MTHSSAFPGAKVLTLAVCDFGKKIFRDRNPWAGRTNESQARSLRSIAEDAKAVISRFNWALSIPELPRSHFRHSLYGKRFTDDG